MAIDGDRPKIGLVLSGGGAKGFAHIGTLKMLDSLEIPVDYISGTSMGGIVGALYAIGYSGAEIEELVHRTDWEEIFTDKPPRAELPYFEKKETGKYQVEFDLDGLRPKPPSGLIFGQKISLLFSGLTFPFEHITDFNQMPIPFRCVAVDLVTGDQVVLQKGSLSKAMRATMAIPTVFSPVDWGDSLLIDGGIANNLPVDVVKEMGADIVIAVDVGTPLMERQKLTTAIAVLEQSISILGIDRWKENVKKSDVLIQPDLTRYKVGDFSNDKIQEILHSGNLAAEKSKSTLVALKEKYCHPTMTNIENDSASFQIQQQQKEGSGKEKQTPIIHGISIVGYQSLPFKYIYNLLGMNPFDKLDTKVLSRRIMEMYGLGYFESIRYDIEPRGENYVHLKLIVKERSKRRLRLGLRYDDMYKLISAISIQGTNFLVSGLRYEHELLFSGMKQYHFKTYYPSRTLNLPVYPYFRFLLKNIDTNIYDGYEGVQVARYKDRSTTVGVGFGLLFSKSINFELEYQYESMDIEPNIGLNDPLIFPSWDDKLRKIHAKLIVDRLDDTLLPSRGFLFKMRYEGSFKEIGSDLQYHLLKISADLYFTFMQRHTVRLFGFRGISQSLPIYKFINKGSPRAFVGMDYHQLVGTKMSILRLDYRYRLYHKLYVKCIANVGFDLEMDTHTEVIKPCYVTGYGIGLKVLTPVGPIELIISRGDKNFMGPRKKQNVTYFMLGTNIGKLLYD